MQVLTPLREAGARGCLAVPGKARPCRTSWQEFTEQDWRQVILPGGRQSSGESLKMGINLPGRFSSSPCKIFHFFVLFYYKQAGRTSFFSNSFLPPTVQISIPFHRRFLAFCFFSCIMFRESQITQWQLLVLFQEVQSYLCCHLLVLPTSLFRLCLRDV